MEIMQIARAIPEGLVDHIVAGHHHNGVAHIINGISVTSSYSNTQAFSRTDFTLDLRSGKVLSRKVFPPQRNEGEGSYEGQALRPMAAIQEIAGKARDVADALQAQKPG